MRTRTVVAPLMVGAALLAGCSSTTTTSAPPTATASARGLGGAEQATDTLPRVQSIVARALDIAPSAVTPNATLTELGADSLAQVEILMSCEEEFGIMLADDDVCGVTTANALVDRINAQR